MAVTRRLAYRSGLLLSLIGCLLLFAVHGDVGAQAPDDKSGAAKKDKSGLFDDAEIDETKAKPNPGGPPPIIDLKKAAGDRKLHNAVRRLFADLAEPHDVINYFMEKPFKAKGYSKVKPLPKYYDDKNPVREELTVEEFNDAWEISDKPLKVPSKEVHSIKPYEKVALDAVVKFMEQPIGDLPQYSQALAADQALVAVLDWHEKARARGVRTGMEWDTLVAGLRKQLLRANLIELKQLTELHDWEAAFGLAKRLTEGNPDEGAVAGPFAELMHQSLDSPLDPQMRDRARQQLEKLHEAFPNNKPLNEIVDRLKKDTEKLLAEAKKLASNSSATREELEKSQHLIAQALETWPSLPGLRDYAGQIRVKYPILRVGVRALPKFMSPSMACTDTERRVVEFLFESLVKYSPDAKGMGRYEPGLAEGRAEVIPLGRQFHLSDDARWSNDQDQTSNVTANDVYYTVQQLQKNRGFVSGAPPGELFADKNPVSTLGMGNLINVRLSQGYLEPLSLMTFKIVPKVQSQGTDPATFAENPVGSGPFKFVPSKEPRYENRRQYLSFVVNDNYRLRKSKLGLPRLSEVRLFTYTDAAAELKDNFLDMMLDLTVAEADKLKETGGPLGFRLTLPEPISELPNRRVYFLAINHRKADLGTEQNEKIRRALAQAIDREKLLDDCFRGSFSSVLHKRLNGPFPATSWANDPGLVAQNKKKFDPVMAPSILNELTKELSKKNLRFQPPTLSLKYPSGSPDVERAMQAMATQIQTSLPGFVIKPQKVDPYALRDMVEKTYDYDLAYYYYDFPDDTNSLWPLLGGDNYLGYSSTHLSDLLRKLLHHCEFAEVKKLNHELHRYVDLHVPLIPLWQIDPVHAIHKSVKTVPFDRHLLFTDIERWELKGRN